MWDYTNIFELLQYLQEFPKRKVLQLKLTNNPLCFCGSNEKQKLKEDESDRDTEEASTCVII